MSALPAPLRIRRAWRTGDLSLDRCAAEIASYVPLARERFARPVEARSWMESRGEYKGALRRIDVAYQGTDDELRFASLRRSPGSWRLIIGKNAAR